MLGANWIVPREKSLLDWTFPTTVEHRMNIILNIKTRTLVTENNCQLKTKQSQLINRTKWSRRGPCVNHHDTAEVNQKEHMTNYWSVKTTQVATKVDQLKWKRWVIKQIPHAEEVGRASIYMLYENLTCKWWGRHQKPKMRAANLTYKWWGKPLGPSTRTKYLTF